MLAGIMYSRAGRCLFITRMDALLSPLPPFQFTEMDSYRVCVCVFPQKAFFLEWATNVVNLIMSFFPPIY